MTDLIEEAEAMAERLGALHVWPQFVADYHADILLPRQSKGLYQVGEVSTEAAALIRRMIAQMRQDAEYVAVERGGRIGKV